MYLYQIMQKSKELNGITRIRTMSGDTLIGKFTDEDDTNGLIEFDLSKGGTIHIKWESIESITLLDNLQILEDKASGQK